ncbi:hypothetical protein Tco_0799474 [Tanacetum coccineum]|uniref:Uncharacterized protein n=1 Tax=Tanacetum coccineum TaxID=301880 RepID=A0ABQ4ZT27_9ASTR
MELSIAISDREIYENDLIWDDIPFGFLEASVGNDAIWSIVDRIGQSSATLLTNTRKIETQEVPGKAILIKARKPFEFQGWRPSGYLRNPWKGVHPNVTIPLLPDFGGVTDGTRAKSEEEHEVHLKTILDLLEKEKLYAKFSKCEFWLKEVQFLGHVVNRDGIRIVKPLTLLTQNNKAYMWGDKQDEAFQILKEKLCNAPVLALPDGPDDSVVYCEVITNKVMGAFDAAWQSDAYAHQTVEEQ